MRSPGIAAFLSFVWPGAGQWYAGARRTGLLFAAPILVVTLVLASWLLQGPETLVIRMLTPGTALTIVVLVGLLAVWRVISMVDVVSRLGGRTVWRRPAVSGAVAVMVVVVLVSHAAAENLAWLFYQADSKIFS